MIPKVYEKIERPEKVKVQAFDEKGAPFTLDADGLLARVIQHEYDHLDGILFIDRGDPEFKQATIESFKQKEKRKHEKAARKEAQARKIAAKIAFKKQAAQEATSRC